MTTVTLVFMICARCQKPFRGGQSVTMYRVEHTGVLFFRYLIPNEILAVCKGCEPIQPVK